MAKAALKSAPAPAPAPADERDAANEAEGQDAPKKKRRGRLGLIATALVLALGGGAAAWYFSAPGDAAPEPKKAVEKPAIFVNLETFTVNLQPEVGDQYLQTTLTVKASDERVNEAMKQQMPEVRNALLLIMSSKTASQILTVEGKQQLADEVLAAVKKTLPEAVREHINAVYYTSFVVQ